MTGKTIKHSKGNTRMAKRERQAIPSVTKHMEQDVKKYV